jgi:Spherulation-specific family 4
LAAATFPGTNSGPGSTGNSKVQSFQFPLQVAKASNRIPRLRLYHGVAQLYSYSNVETIGYVITDYATRDIKDVEDDVSLYAGWSGYSDSDIAVSGIFFDTEDDLTSIEYMTSVTDYARDQGLDYTVFNPGTITAVAAYYEAADIIVNQEIAYSSWSDSTVTDIPEYKDASAILIHDFSTSADISSIVSLVVEDDIASFYATSDCCYNAIDSTLLDGIAPNLQSARNVSEVKTFGNGGEKHLGQRENFYIDSKLSLDRSI